MAATVLEKYTYDVNVQKGGSDEQSVKVVAWNTSGTQQFSVLTDVNGDIVQQSVEANSHSVTGFVTTTTGRNPFRIRALKYNNRTFQIGKNINEASADTFFTVTNPDITQTTKATVDAYTGITISHAGDSVTLDGTGGTPVNDMNRLYDRLQSDGFDNPQYEYISASDVSEVMSTGDKQNYTFNYDLVISGFDFNGQNRAMAAGTGRDLTVSAAGGNVSDLSWTGDVVAGASWDATTIDNFDVDGDFDLSSGGTPRTITLTDCQWDSVSSTTSGWTLNLSGDSSVTTNNDPGNITIQNTKTFTVTGLDTGSRVIWLTRPGETELENKLESGGSASYTYNYTVDTDIWVSILSTTKFNELREAQLLNQDQTLIAGQRNDPFYSNP